MVLHRRSSLGRSFPAAEPRTSSDAVSAFIPSEGRDTSDEQRQRHEREDAQTGERLTGIGPITIGLRAEEGLSLRRRGRRRRRSAPAGPGVQRAVGQALPAGDRDGGVVVVLYLAVDDFTQINDYHGHEAGDLSLIVLSTRLRDALREEDTVARLGGDEFVLDRRRMGLVGARSRRRLSEGRHVLHGERAGAVCRAPPLHCVSELLRSGTGLVRLVVAVPLPVESVVVLFCEAAVGGWP
jgi:hypothetical protein